MPVTPRASEMIDGEIRKNLFDDSGKAAEEASAAETEIEFGVLHSSMWLEHYPI